MKLRELFEAPATAVMAFGRMNPPTIGHAKLVDAIKSQPGDPFIFLSQSQKPKTDPLAFEDKLRYAKFFFPNVTIGNPEVKTIIQALQKVESLGYQQLIYVAGSDRVQAFEELLNKYNGKDFTFRSIKVVSAGERDPDAEGAEGMSASKMRQAAADNDKESFKQGVPQQEVADEMFKAVRQGMGVMDTVPAEGIEEDEQPAESYIVKPGDTIWAIATRFADSNYDGDVKAGAKDILELNGIKNPKSLRPGQKLEIGYFMGGMSSGATRGLPSGGFKAYESDEKPDMEKLLKALKKKLKDEGGAAGFDPLKDVAKKMGVDLTPTKLKSMSGISMHRDGDYILEEVKPGQTLPKQIKVLKMPTPPQAPKGPDGTDENGTQIGTTPKGNRTVKSGAGTYIFTPKGKLMLYMSPKIGGLQQTHNPIKQTVTVNFDTSIDGAGIDQKATYDMSGKLISGDNTSIRSGTLGISTDKDKGTTMDYTTLSGTKHSLNSKDPKKYDKLAAMKKDMDQSSAAFKKANTATLAKMGIKR